MSIGSVKDSTNPEMIRSHAFSAYYINCVPDVVSLISRLDVWR